MRKIKSVTLLSLLIQAVGHLLLLDINRYCVLLKTFIVLIGGTLIFLIDVILFQLLLMITMAAARLKAS